MAKQDTLTVGVIGAGRIGQPIVGHLIRHGFTVQAYDIDHTKRAAVEERGGRWATLRMISVPTRIDGKARSCCEIGAHNRSHRRQPRAVPYPIAHHCRWRP